MSHELDLYARAFLCGGPERVARTAVLMLSADERIQVAERSPYRVTVARRVAGDGVERFVLDRISGSGLPLRMVLRSTAGSGAVGGRAAVLLEKGLLRRSLRGWLKPSQPGAELVARLAESDHDDVAGGFAVLGVPALPAGALRDVFAALPDEPGFPLKLRGTFSGRGYDDRGDYSAPSHDSGGGDPP